MKIAIVDDYQNVALRMADWSALAGRAEITVFNDHLAAPVAIIERLTLGPSESRQKSLPPFRLDLGSAAVNE